MMGADETNRREKRPWVAAVLSFLWPGLGHAYLRAWARALTWLLLLVTVTIILIPPSIQPSSFSFDAMMDAYAQIPDSVSLVVLALTVLCSLDAYRLAKARNREIVTTTADETVQVENCPKCGKELDEDLDFCPWCSYELAGDDEDSENQ